MPRREVSRYNLRRRQKVRAANKRLSQIGPFDFGGVAPGEESESEFIMGGQADLIITFNTDVDAGDLAVLVGGVREFTHPFLQEGRMFRGYHAEKGKPIKVRAREGAEDGAEFEIYALGITLGDSVLIARGVIGEGGPPSEDGNFLVLGDGGFLVLGDGGFLILGDDES